MKTIFFTLLTLALLITSCKKEEYQPQPQPQPQVDTVDSTQNLNEMLKSYYGIWEVDSVLVDQTIEYPSDEEITINTDNTISTKEGTFPIYYKWIHSDYFYDYCELGFENHTFFYDGFWGYLGNGIQKRTLIITNYDGNHLAYCHKIVRFNINLTAI